MRTTSTALALVGGPEWCEPVNLTALNTPWDEKALCISPDGTRLYFTRFRGDAPGAPKETNIWASSWDGKQWSAPERLGPNVNISDNVGDPSITGDAKKLFFHADAPGGYGLEDIYVSEWDGKDWGPAKNLGPKVNSPSKEMCPAISPDGKTLFFMLHDEKPGGLGGEDIYMTKLVDGEWQEPTNVGPTINSPGDDFCPWVGPDGTLYFASNYKGRPGTYWDIWFSSFVDGKWLPAQRLRPPINTEYPDCCPSLTADGKKLFFASKRPGGLGGWDIWMAERKE